MKKNLSLLLLPILVVIGCSSNQSVTSKKLDPGSSSSEAISLGHSGISKSEAITSAQRAIANNKDFADISILFPPLKTEFETQPAYAKRIASIDYSKTYYFDVATEYSSYDADMHTVTVKIKGDGFCISDLDYVSCKKRVPALLIKDDKKLEKYVASNGFGAKTSIIKGEGIEYFFIPRNGWELESEKGSLLTTKSGFMSADIFLTLSMSAETAKLVKSGQKTLLLTVGAKLCGNSDGCRQTNFFQKEAKFTSPMEAKILKIATNAALISASVSEKETKTVLDTLVSKYL